MLNLNRYILTRELSSAIDMLCSGRLGQLSKSDIETQDFLQNFETENAPVAFTDEERAEWLSQLSEVAVSSDAFVSCLSPS